MTSLDDSTRSLDYLELGSQLLEPDEEQAGDIGTVASSTLQESYNDIMNIDLSSITVERPIATMNGRPAEDVSTARLRGNAVEVPFLDGYN